MVQFEFVDDLLIESNCHNIISSSIDHLDSLNQFGYGFEIQIDSALHTNTSLTRGVYIVSDDRTVKELQFLPRLKTWVSLEDSA